jgi:hypothetical protein
MGEISSFFWELNNQILKLINITQFDKLTTVIILNNPAVTYGAETWTMTKKEEQALLIFERKIFRRIYGAKYEDGEWKSRTNRDLE